MAAAARNAAVMERTPDPAILSGIDYENSPKDVAGTNEGKGDECVVKVWHAHLPAIQRSRNLAQ
jgi:hypothetical protein